jgi:hypothetical protein
MSSDFHAQWANANVKAAAQFVALRVCSGCHQSSDYPETDEGWTAEGGVWASCPKCSATANVKAAQERLKTDWTSDEEHERIYEEFMKSLQKPSARPDKETPANEHIPGVSEATTGIEPVEGSARSEEPGNA